MLEKWTGEIVGKMHIYEISLEEMATELGVSKSYISRILNGTRKPPDIQQRMKTALNNIITKKERN